MTSTTDTTPKFFDREGEADDFISLHIPAATARDILEKNEWTRNARGQWVDPHGNAFWMLDEAFEAFTVNLIYSA